MSGSGEEQPRTLQAVCVRVHWMLEGKKRTMDYSLMASTLIMAINHEGRSALPHSPVIAQRCAVGTRRRLSDLRGRLASFLHQAAWVIEPAPGAVPRVAGRPPGP